MTARRRVVAALLSVALSSTNAWADEDRELARRLFVRGDQAFAAGDWAAALTAYTAAYDAAPLPGFLFNIAQCHRKLEHWAEARAFFQRYLDGVPRAFNRPDVERLLVEIDTLLAATAGPVVPEPSPPEPPPPPPPVREPPVREPPPRAPAAEPGVKIGVPTWIAIGGSVVLAAGAVVFALDLADAQGEFDDPSLDCSSEIERCRDLRDRGDTSALLTTLLASASVAGLVASGILLALDVTDRPDVRVSLGPSGIVAEGTF